MKWFDVEVKYYAEHLLNRVGICHLNGIIIRGMQSLNRKDFEVKRENDSLNLEKALGTEGAETEVDDYE